MSLAIRADSDPEGEAEMAGPDAKEKGKGGSSSGVPTVERWGVTCESHVRGKQEPDTGG